ncbi:hypothetical protein P43SY_005789 [Pythium insidiosum]|uniref:ACB domain-containing protein n=1 Tax=Pythium insidiosum TaxID=114742 RepID=A0AAD5LTE2_PYTIN|nr:hypothetical protein P43SY_005789 [Pythium insidiosum]
MELDWSSWSWTHVVIALLVALLLPFVLRGARDRRPHGRASKTLTEYMQQGLSEPDAKFQVAVDFVAMQANAKLSNEQRLTLYAFFKQGSLGKCSGEKPSAIDMVARAKWESWFSLGEMPAAVAKQQYVGLVQELFPHFDVTGERNEPRTPHPLADNIQSGDTGDLSMVGAVSMPTVDMSTPEWQVKEDLFHFASTGDVAKVSEALARGEDVDATDDEGRTMLHWAVDRSQREVVELLLARHASPNAQDSDGMTPLHYAVNCEDEDMTQLLVNGGASADIEDNDGETPLSCATEEIQELLARGAQA